MKSKEDNISLIGFMGAGKSTVGPILAKKLKKKFVELDSEIEMEMGISVSEIFTMFGEDYFRRIEKRMLKRILFRRGVVVSCGGGVVLDKENRALLKERSVVIWLDISEDEVVRRLAGDKNRPLLAGDFKRNIPNLLKDRFIFYEETFDIRIDVNSMDVDRIVSAILTKIENQHDA